MKRRGFLQALLTISGTAALPANSQTVKPEKNIKLLETSLAGFQYYEGERLFPQLNIGDPLQLNRDPANKYDKRAVEVYWRTKTPEYKLGYIPRIANMSISQMLDSNEPLTASIVSLTRSDNPWQSLSLVVQWHQNG